MSEKIRATVDLSVGLSVRESKPKLIELMNGLFIRHPNIITSYEYNEVMILDLFPIRFVFIERHESGRALCFHLWLLCNAGLDMVWTRRSLTNI